MTYSEKLRDPRWQKKRLLILERDEFTCRSCGNSSKTLHVHHLSYIKGNSPWEYPDKNLLTLCEVCHEVYHSIEKDLAKGNEVELLKIITLALTFVAIFDDPDMGIMIKLYGNTLLSNELNILSDLILELSSNQKQLSNG